MKAFWMVLLVLVAVVLAGWGGYKYAMHRVEELKIKGGGFGPPAPPPDPPIIVHGGSFHVQVYDGASDPGDGSKGVTIPVGTTDVIDLGNYTPVKGTFASFTSPWEVDICDDGGLSKDGSKCTGAGVAIVNAGTTGITVTQLDSNDKFGRLGRIPSPAWNYAYKLRPGSAGKPYRPGNVFVTTGGNSYKYTCGPDGDGDGDWTTCWVALGQF